MRNGFKNNLGGNMKITLVDDGPYFKVWLDDIDVSDRCFGADDKEGYVNVYKWNKDGNCYTENFNIKTGEKVESDCQEYEHKIIDGFPVISKTKECRVAKENLYGKVRKEKVKH